MRFEWEINGHQVVAIKGNTRFEAVSIYVDGKPIGQADYGKSLVPSLRYEFSVEGERVVLVSSFDKLDCIVKGKYLSSGKTEEKTETENEDNAPDFLPYLYRSLSLLIPILALIFGFNKIALIISVFAAVLYFVIVSIVTSTPTIERKKKHLILLGALALMIVISFAIHFGMTFMQS